MSLSLNLLRYIERQNCNSITGVRLCTSLCVCVQDEAGGRCSSLMEQHSTQERELQRHCQEQLTLLEEHKVWSTESGQLYYKEDLVFYFCPSNNVFVWFTPLN